MRTNHCLRILAMSMSCVLLSNLTTGCTTTTRSSSSPQPGAVDAHIESPSTMTTDASSAPIPVVRYDRYTLVELVAEPAQRDLMQQIVEVTIPPALDATVGDALRYVLLRSGYRLCSSVETSVLYLLPLPAAHLHLGPLTLRDALLTLAGPAWDLSVDDAFRQVCFEPHPAMPTLEVQP